MLEKENAKTQEPLVELMQILQIVQTDTIEAELNAVMMVDNDGNKIKY